MGWCEESLWGGVCVMGVCVMDVYVMGMCVYVMGWCDLCVCDGCMMGSVCDGGVCDGSVRWGWCACLVHVRVRGQLSGVSSLLSSLVSSRMGPGLPGLPSECFHLFNHLVLKSILCIEIYSLKFN